MRHFFRRSFLEIFFFCYFFSMKRKLILIGKAASGKDFLQKQLVSNGWVSLKQYTTRPKRPTEVGDEYHFVSEEEFDSISHKLCSVQNFNGWKYGYDIDEALDSDVMIFSPANYLSLIYASISDSRCKCASLLYHSILVYIDIDEETRRKRLSYRYAGGNEDDSIERRIQADDEDFKPFDIIDWGNRPLDRVRLCSKEEVDDFLKKLLS